MPDYIPPIIVLLAINLGLLAFSAGKLYQKVDTVCKAVNGHLKGQDGLHTKRGE